VVNAHLLSMLAALTLVLFNTALNAAMLEAHVDKKELLINEHVTLTISLINSDTRLRAQGVDPNVDLTSLTDDFELGLPQASNHYSPFRNRGRSTSEIKVTLFPRREGKLTIPSFSIDDESSEPITINVHQLSTDNTPIAFTKSGVLKTALWLREQTIVYLDLYHRVALKSAKLGGALESEPKLQIQLSQLAQTDRTEKYNGLNYNVTRTSWAVAPAINQPIHLYLPDVWIETITGEQLRFPFNDITIETMPLPEDVPSHVVIGKPRLTQSAISDKINQHQSFQLSITLEAATNVINLSAIPPSLEFPAGLKVYSESKPRQLIEGDENGNTTVTYHYFIMPLEPGNYHLPDLEIPYFDPERSQLSLATLKGQQFNVMPAAIPANHDLLAETTLPTQTGIKQETPHHSALPWIITTLLASFLWAITLLTWYYQHKKSDAKKRPHSQLTQTFDDSDHPLQTQLLNAFGTRTLDQGLTQWESQNGTDDETRAIIQQVQQYYYGQQKNGTTIEQLQNQVDSLIHRIKKRQPIIDHKDSWQPDAFTAKQP